MPTIAIPRAVTQDLKRVTETLGMIAPRWTVWIMMTIKAQEPMRFSEFRPALPWLADPSVAIRLRHLSTNGLVEREEKSPRHVAYRLTPRGTALVGILQRTLQPWADEHLPKELDENGNAKPIAPAVDIEDALALITPAHATPLLWVVRAAGAARSRDLAAAVKTNTALLYSPLRQLAADGLLERLPHAQGYRLTPAGHDLAPTYRKLSAWAAGRTSASAATHKLWTTQAPTSADEHRPWTATAHARRTPSGDTHTARPPAPTATPAWRATDLFSHNLPPLPAGTPTAGGRSR